MVKNILITGGAGYIGSHVTEVLLKKKRKFFYWIIYLQDTEN